LCASVMRVALISRHDGSFFTFGPDVVADIVRAVEVIEGGNREQEVRIESVRGRSIKTRFS
jgi:hypothetical protein